MRLAWLGKSRKADRKPSSAAIYRTEIIADVPVPERGESVRFFSRKLVRSGKLRDFSNGDLREGLLFCFYLGVAAILPVAWWAPVCHWVSTLRRRRHLRKEFRGYDAAVKSVLGDGIDTRGLFNGHRAAAHRRWFLVAAHLVGGRRWSPAIRLEGLDGLQTALLRGRGAIVWCDQFTAQTIMGKRALFEAGIEACQVSVNFHGFSESRFGLNMLNRPLFKVEDRFLKSRIIFERADAYQVTARIQNLLKENGVVLMTNTTHAGSTFAEAGIGEHGWTHLASAPANFAARAGAALFAMSTLETVPFREYRAIVSTELKPASGQAEPQPMRDMAAKNPVLQASYILLKRDRLFEALKLCPEQMMVWFNANRLAEDPKEPRAGNGAD